MADDETTRSRRRAQPADQSAETSESRPVPGRAGPGSLDRFEIEREASQSKTRAETVPLDPGANDPLAADVAAPLVPGAAVVAAALEGELGDSASKLDEAGNALGDDGGDETSGFAATTGSLDLDLRRGTALGDEVGLNTGLPGSTSPTSGDDLTVSVVVDEDPFADETGDGVTRAGPAFSGVGDPSGSGMGVIGSASPDDLRQVDQSTMTDDGGASDSQSSSRDLLSGAIADQQLGGDASQSAVVAATKDAAAQITGDSDEAVLARMTLAQQGGWDDEASDADKAALAKLAADAADDAPPPADDPPADDPPPADPPADDGTQTQSAPDADVESTRLPGREPISDVINLGVDGEIDSPESLKYGLIDEDEWTTPTEDDMPIADPRDFGQIDPGTQIQEGDGDLALE